MEFIQVDIENLISLAIRLAINFLVAFLLIFRIYRTSAVRKPFIFSLFMFNLIIFIMGNMFNNVLISVGSGLGLFAIFTMLRYRSEALELKEMTYLFLLIAVGFINAIGGEISIYELLLLNVAIILLTYCLEKSCLSQRIHIKKIKYNNLEHIKPEEKNQLLMDLFVKTGIKAKDVEIDSINFPENCANMTLYYLEENNNGSEKTKNEHIFLPPHQPSIDQKETNNNVRTLHFNIPEK